MTRRHLLAGAGAAAGVGGVGVLLAPLLPAADAAAPATPVVPAAVNGTPTDLAQAHTDQAWTREADGSVWTYDRKAGFWRRWRDQRWATVLTYGIPVVAHWGKPSGPFESVMVFGKAPAGGGGSGTPTPTPTGGGGTPTPSHGQPSGGSTAGNGYNRLAHTGFDVEKFGLTGAAVVAAGAVLTRRAQAPRPAHAGRSTSQAASGSAPAPCPSPTGAGPAGSDDRCPPVTAPSPHPIDLDLDLDLDER